MDEQSWRLSIATPEWVLHFNRKKKKKQDIYNPFCVGKNVMPMQTLWIQASRHVTWQLAWDPTCLPVATQFIIPNQKQADLQGFEQQTTLRFSFRKIPSIQWNKLDLTISDKIDYQIVEGEGIDEGVAILQLSQKAANSGSRHTHPLIRLHLTDS